jgi:cell division protein FtsL
MEVLTLLIAVVALVIATLAYQRTGGTYDLRRQIDELSEKTECATKGVREMTADALGRLEIIIRGQQKSSSSNQEPPEDNPPTTEHKP